MKYLLLLIISVTTINISSAQSFEGTLTYAVTYNVNEEKLSSLGVTKEMMLATMKNNTALFDEMVYHFKDGNYIRKINGGHKMHETYLSNENLIYTFREDSEEVIVINAAKTGARENANNASLFLNDLSDSTKVILGDTCHLIKIDWGMSMYEEYWYNPNIIPIDPALFSKHNYENLNKLLNKTSSFPMEITRTVSDFMSMTISITKIEEKEIDETLFTIPELKESKNKRHKELEKTTGNKIMTIVN